MRVDLGQPLDDGLEIDRAAGRCLEQSALAPGAVVPALFAIAIEQPFFRAARSTEHRAVVRPVQTPARDMSVVVRQIEPGIARLAGEPGHVEPRRRMPSSPGRK